MKNFTFTGKIVVLSILVFVLMIAASSIAKVYYDDKADQAFFRTLDSFNNDSLK